MWVGLHGVPLAGLPKADDVERVTLSLAGAGEREITGSGDIALLIKAANLLNYRLWGETEGSPVISVVYHLKNGDDIYIEASGAVMWWHGKAHAIKEPDMFVNIIRGLFFSA